MKKETDPNAKVIKLRKAFAKGGVTARMIKNVYGDYAMNVLLPSLLTQDKVDGPRTTFKTLGNLPTAEEYQVMLRKRYTYSAQNLLEEAYSVLEELASEAREVADNMESGNLGQTTRAQTFSETADVLEGLSAPDLDDEAFTQAEVYRLPDLSDRSGRAHRRDEAVSDIRSACDEVESYIESMKEAGGEEYDEDHFSEAESAIEEMRNHADEAEGCEFPGMFG